MNARRAMPARSFLLKDDPYSDFGGCMEFRLTYEGPLLSAQERSGWQAKQTRADHKHEIRKVFQRQLKQLWSITDWLRDWETPRRCLLSEELANSHLLGPFRFVPLVTERFTLLCGLDILFLRADPPGAAISAGDIDNRIKTIIDALKKPSEMSQVGKYQTPDSDEDPFYVLLEEDRLVDRLRIETDTLLEPTGKTTAISCDARLVITVNVRPRYPSLEAGMFA